MGDTDGMSNYEPREDVVVHAALNQLLLVVRIG